jgi:hypothetical protein
VGLRIRLRWGAASASISRKKLRKRAFDVVEQSIWRLQLSPSLLRMQLISWRPKSFCIAAPPFFDPVDG